MTEKIVLGGGCFWCIEAVYQMLRGVESVTSGYAGGDEGEANYQRVSGGNTDHVEVVQVVFDPSVISFDQMLAVFFTAHDPTSLNRQGADAGTQYRSIIYYTTEAQKNAIANFIKKLTDDGVYAKPIVTAVEALEKFYPAEAYHQNYYAQNRDANPYCQVVIDPKVAKIRASFANLLRKNG